MITDGKKQSHLSISDGCDFNKSNAVKIWLDLPYIYKGLK